MGLLRKTMSIGTLGMGVSYRSEKEKTAVHRRRQRKHMSDELTELRYANRLAAEALAAEKLEDARIAAERAEIADPTGVAAGAQPALEREKNALERWTDRLDAKNRATQAKTAEAKRVRAEAKAARKAGRTA